MPTYTINGKKITTSKALSDSEIDEIAKDLGASTTESVPRGPGAIPGGSGYYGSPENTAAQKQQGSLFGPTAQRAMDNAMAGAMAVPALGAVAGGLRFLARGGRAAPYAENLAQAVLPRTGGQLIREGAIGAGAGAVAGEVGSQAAERFGEGARLPGEIAGGVFGGLGVNTVLGGARLAGDAAGSVVKSYLNKGEAERVSGLLGSYNAQSKWRAALEANPDLAPNMLRADEIEALTKINLPITAAAKDDATVKTLVQQQIARQENATFQQELRNQEKAAQAAVVAAQRRLSANPRSVEAYAELQSNKAAAEAAKTRAKAEINVMKREQGLQRIDDRIAELSAEISSTGAGKTDVGTRITNLIKTREKAVKAEFEPLYSSLVKEGMETGAQMPASNLQALQGFIESEGAKRIFETMPRLSGVINKVIRSKQAQQQGNELFGEFPIEGVTREAPRGGFFLNAEEANSLKKAVNEALRDTQSGTADKRIIMELKRLTDEGLDAMGDFGAKLKATDQAYRTKVGEPFLDANGVVAVDRATFVERTVPLLTSNASSLRQIKNAVGDAEGFNEIVNDAWLHKIANTASLFRNGELNTTALNNFIKKNKEAIDEVPGLEARLRGVAGRVEVLAANRSKLMQAQKEGSVEALEKAMRQNQNLWQEATQTTGGIVGYVERALQTPNKMGELMVTAGANRVAQEGIKSATLEAAMRSPNRVQFMEEHAKAFDRLFGAGYTAEVKAMLEAADRLAKYPIKGTVNIGASKSTGFEQVTGSKPTQILAEARNPVIGQFRVMANAMSRYIGNRSGQVEDQEIQNLLRNRKAVSEATKAMKDIEEEAKRVGALGQRALKYAGQFAKNAAFAGFFGGAAGGLLGSTDLLEQAPERVYVEPEMEVTE